MGDGHDEHGRVGDAGALLVATGLCRDFGDVRAVDAVSLTLTPGTVYGFLGPNGAGKTTTIRMLAGLLRPTGGDVRVAGRTFERDGAEARRFLGLVPDKPPLYEHLTVRQYIGFVASLYGTPAAERDARAEPLLEQLELTGKADSLCRALSHGMRKKAHLIAVLCTAPALLLMDEPTTGLDPRSARHLKDVLLQRRDEGTAVFLSTHVLSVAEEICDRVGILSAGRLVAEGTMAELRARTGSERSLEEIFLQLTEEPEETTEAEAS